MSISGISSSYSNWYLSSLYNSSGTSGTSGTSSASGTSNTSSISSLLNSLTSSGTSSSTGTYNASGYYQTSGSSESPPPPPPPPSEEEMSEMDSQMSSSIIDSKDTNGDGVLSADELGISSDEFDAMDSDGDGSISSSELTSGLKAKRQEMMSQMRTQFEQNGTANSDGTITGLNTLMSQATSAYGSQAQAFTPDVDSFLSTVFGSSYTGSSLSTTV